jgi:VIT1/CCC1 family predicted Fe2+/Mn2+ transporter
MNDQKDSKVSRSTLAFMAGGMFFLGGAINIVPHLFGSSTSTGVGAMFLGLGAAWLAIGAMFKKQAENS